MSLEKDLVHTVSTSQVYVQPGATLAAFYQPLAGQSSWAIKYFGGGTLLMVGVSAGMTMTAAQLVTASSNGYIFGSSEVLGLGGPTRFYLMALGATTGAHLIRGFGAGGQ